MSLNQKIEDYLTNLDRALNGITVSDRAEIITEIRSHILEAMEREPERSVDSILSSMGEPETVGNRYLMERGLKAGKAPKSPMVKWLTIGFLGTVAMALIAFVIMIYKFTPLIKVDEEKGSVQIMGGLIDIKDDDVSYQSISGKREINMKALQKLEIEFLNGSFTISESPDRNLVWECKTESESAVPVVEEREIEFKLKNAKCMIQVPVGLPINLEGGNAKVVFRELASPVTAKIGNGKVSFFPKPGTEYKYDLKVGNGDIDSFESSQSPSAIPIQIQMNNGKIAKD